MNDVNIFGFCETVLSFEIKVILSLSSLLSFLSLQSRKLGTGLPSCGGVQNIVNSVKNKMFGARIFEGCFSCFDVVIKHKKWKMFPFFFAFN